MPRKSYCRITYCERHFKWCDAFYAGGCFSTWAKIWNGKIAICKWDFFNRSNVLYLRNLKKQELCPFGSELRKFALDFVVLCSEKHKFRINYFWTCVFHNIRKCFEKNYSNKIRAPLPIFLHFWKKSQRENQVQIF